MRLPSRWELACVILDALPGLHVREPSVHLSESEIPRVRLHEGRGIILLVAADPRKASCRVVGGVPDVVHDIRTGAKLKQAVRDALHERF